MTLSDSLLAHIAVAAGRDVSAATNDKFRDYYDLLLRWNDRAGLTTITDPAEVVDKHFCDSALAAKVLSASEGWRARRAVPGASEASEPGRARDGSPSAAPSLIDVGSGGGFPGIVLCLLMPELGHITLVEATAKKVSFLRTVIRELKLENIAAVQEHLTPSTEPRFALAVSRATFAPADWLKLAATLVAPGGHVLAMSAEAELPESSAGLTRVLLSKTQLPISHAPRTLGLYRRE